MATDTRGNPLGSDGLAMADPRGRADPAVVETVLSVLAEAPAGLRLGELTLAPALVRLRARPPDVVRALAQLRTLGLVRLGPLRRWRLTAGSGVAASGPAGPMLTAVAAEVRRAPAVAAEALVPDEAAGATGWAFAVRYLRHAARILAEEERARVAVFADRATELVQPLRPRGPWWPEAEERIVLRVARAALGDPFQAALARRAADEVALVWGLRVRQPQGSETPVWTGLLAWPALWRPADQYIEVEPLTPLPAVDMSALRLRGRDERRRVAEWLGLLAEDDEQAIVAVDPPELGRRLGPLLGGQLRDALDPLQLRYVLPLSAEEGVYNLCALVLPDPTRFSRGAVRELRELAQLVEAGQFRDTALASLFVEDGAADEQVGALYEPLELSGSQLDAARAACGRRLTVVTGPPGTGKSQVVSAIAASVALSGGTVLIAARNHRAIDAVEERLTALGPGWFLRLSSPEGLPAFDWQQLCQYVLAASEQSPEHERAAGYRRRLAELDHARRRADCRTR